MHKKIPQAEVELDLQTRSTPQTEDICTRSVPMSSALTTLDEKTRSVEVVGATESPVPMFDSERWEIIPEVLLMSGCQMPDSRQIPLLDTHSRYSTSDVIGSFRDMTIEGDKLIGRAMFSTAPEAEGAWLKTREGHLTDYSVGYRTLEKEYVPANTTTNIQGRSFAGPVNIVTKWTPREMSSCPIGADEQAKARSATPPEKQQKEQNMNKELRLFLESRGLPKGATEEEALRFMETLQARTEPVAPAVPGTNADETRAAAIRDEHARSSEIIAMCERHEVPAEKRAELLKPETTVDAARKAVMDIICERSAANNPGFRSPAQTDAQRGINVGVDERDKFRAAAEDSLILRTGKPVEKAAPGALDLRGFSLRELARESLRISGGSHAGDAMGMIGRALTTSDFPLILANIANKSLFAGYEATSETWQKWCGTGSTSDFKTNTVVRAGETADLDQIREDDEYKYGSRAEAQEQYSIATYGKLFNISRQSIINDDLSALTDIPAAHGEAAGRKVGDLAYAVLTANSAMGDGTALFHANHGNLGTSGVIGTTTIAEAIKLMALQKDIGGKRRLNIAPKFLITSPALAQAAQTFFGSSVIGTQANPNQVNIYAGLCELIFEPRLFDDSATAFYLAGDKGKTVNVYFLNGNQAPYMETKQGWNVDGVEYKVRIDAGAKAIDWKSLLKNAGA
jgi:hypothetical protein